MRNTDSLQLKKRGKGLVLKLFLPGTVPVGIFRSENLFPKSEKQRYLPFIILINLLLMSSLEIVSHYYDCFNRKDWNGMLALLSPDVRHDANQGDSYTGLDHFKDFLAHMDECYDENLTDMVLMAHPDGVHVACEFVVNGIYKKTDSELPPANGQRYVLPAGAFLEVHQGRITRVTTYYNLPLWLKLIGQ